MILLLYFLGSYCKANDDTSYGRDSVLVSIEEVKNINEKLIELKYTKQEYELCSKLNEINNDIICGLKKDSEAATFHAKVETNKKRIWRTTAITLGGVVILLICL